MSIIFYIMLRKLNHPIAIANLFGTLLYKVPHMSKAKFARRAEYSLIACHFSRDHSIWYDELPFISVYCECTYLKDCKRRSNETRNGSKKWSYGLKKIHTCTDTTWILVICTQPAVDQTLSFMIRVVRPIRVTKKSESKKYTFFSNQRFQIPYVF